MDSYFGSLDLFQFQISLGDVLIYDQDRWHTVSCHDDFIISKTVLDRNTQGNVCFESPNTQLRLQKAPI